MLERRAQGLSQTLLPWVPQSLQLVGSVQWGGEGAGSGASGPRGSCSCGGQGAVGTARGHCSSSEDSWEMPSSSSFSSFLGLPLGFLPGAVAVFRVLAAPLFLLPFGRPRGLLGVGTSLGSFGGCLRGLPRPRFSVPSFSCLEARGWLDFELDSLIFLLYGAVRGTGCGARARQAAGWARSGLPGAAGLGAGDRPGLLRCRRCRSQMRI